MQEQAPALGWGQRVGSVPGLAELAGGLGAHSHKKKHELGLKPQLGEHRDAALHIAVRDAGLCSGRGVPGAGGEYTT